MLKYANIDSVYESDNDPDSVTDRFDIPLDESDNDTDSVTDRFTVKFVELESVNEPASTIDKLIVDCCCCTIADDRKYIYYVTELMRQFTVLAVADNIFNDMFHPLPNIIGG